MQTVGVVEDEDAEKGKSAEIYASARCAYIR